MGVPLDLYWGAITPKLLQKYFNAYRQRLQDDLRIQDVANHTLGRYIRIAISDALSGKSKYPDEPLIDSAMDKSKQQEMTDLQMLRMAERNTAILKGVANAKAKK